MMVEFDRWKFAKLLYDICWDKEIGNNQLAEEIGVSAATISRIMSKRKTPDADTLARILHYTKRDFASFIKVTKSKAEESNAENGGAS